MPKWLHDKLAKSADKAGVKDKNAYIYGTMNKIIKSAGGLDALEIKHRKGKKGGVAKP